MSGGVKTLALVGPPDVNYTFEVEGVAYHAFGGKVVPDLPEGKVPSNLWGLGFFVETKANASVKAGKFVPVDVLEE